MARNERIRGYDINQNNSDRSAGGELAENRLQNRARSEPVRLLVGYDLEVAEWVARELDVSSFGDCTSLGVVHKGEIVAGVVFYCYRPPSIEMAIASKSKKWFTRKIIRMIFDYPFNQLNCKRITALVDTGNHQARNFDERLGFVHEGTLRDAHPNGDAEVYGMLKSECRWIR